MSHKVIKPVGLLIDKESINMPIYEHILNSSKPFVIRQINFEFSKISDLIEEHVEMLWHSFYYQDVLKESKSNDNK